MAHFSDFEETGKQNGGLKPPVKSQCLGIPSTPVSLSGFSPSDNRIRINHLKGNDESNQDNCNKLEISRINQLGTVNYIGEEDISVSTGSLMTLKSTYLSATYRIGKEDEISSCSDISENEFKMTTESSRDNEPKKIQKLEEFDYAKRAEEKAARILAMMGDEFKPDTFKRSTTMRSQDESELQLIRRKIQIIRASTPTHDM